MKTQKTVSWAIELVYHIFHQMSKLWCAGRIRLKVSFFSTQVISIIHFMFMFITASLKHAHVRRQNTSVIVLPVHLTGCNMTRALIQIWRNMFTWHLINDERSIKIELLSNNNIYKRFHSMTCSKFLDNLFDTWNKWWTDRLRLPKTARCCSFKSNIAIIANWFTALPTML